LLLIVIVVVMLVMLTSVNLHKNAAALVMPMDPAAMRSAVTGHPAPFITVIPIARALVIGPVAQVDPEINRPGGWTDHYAEGKSTHY